MESREPSRCGNGFVLIVSESLYSNSLGAHYASDKMKWIDAFHTSVSFHLKKRLFTSQLT